MLINTALDTIKDVLLKNEVSEEKIIEILNFIEKEILKDKMLVAQKSKLESEVKYKMEKNFRINNSSSVDHAMSAQEPKKNIFPR